MLAKETLKEEIVGKKHFQKSFNYLVFKFYNALQQTKGWYITKWQHVLYNNQHCPHEATMVTR